MLEILEPSEKSIANAPKGTIPTIPELEMARVKFEAMTNQQLVDVFNFVATIQFDSNHWNQVMGWWLAAFFEVFRNPTRGLDLSAIGNDRVLYYDRTPVRLEGKKVLAVANHLAGTAKV